MLYPLSYWGGSSAAGGRQRSAARAPGATPQHYPTVRVSPKAMIIATVVPHRPSVRESRLTAIPPWPSPAAPPGRAGSTMGSTARPMVGIGLIDNSEVPKVLKPTFTDVNGVKFVCQVTNDAESPHLVVSALQEDGTLKPVMELNNYDAKYMGNACDVYLKQSWANRYTAGSLSALSPEEMSGAFGAEGNPRESK